MKSLRQYIFESRNFKCYIMIGLPGSGKSTWIKNNLPKDIEILSKDLIRQELGIIKDQNIKAIGDKSQEKEVRKIYHKRLDDLLNKEKDFVIDNTNIGSSLMHILNKIKNHNKKSNTCKSVGINIKTPLEVCMKRQNNCIPKSVYDQMKQDFRYLTKDDVDEVINVEYNKKNIKEALDNNLLWKIDKYFSKDDQERKEFYSLVDYCREQTSFNKKDIEEYLKEHPFKNLKKFIDFIDDVIQQETENRDYAYILTVVLKQLIMNKRECLKYTNKKEEA